MARPRWTVRFASQTILDAHAKVDCQGDKRVEKRTTHVSVRILRSRGSGTLRPPSEGEVTGRGGSRSKSRGRIPGSRKAYERGTMDELTTEEVEYTYCGEHAGDGKESHVSAHCGDGGRLIVPPPDTGCGEPSS